MNNEEILQHHEIRITALRLEILKKMRELEYAFSLEDLETKLFTFDKSTIFRTIVLFKNAGLLQTIDDGEGRKKYCLINTTSDGADYFHAHITCTRCGRTFCLKNQKVDGIPVPEGFRVEQISVVIKGVCLSCSTGHPCDSTHFKKWNI